MGRLYSAVILCALTALPCSGILDYKGGVLVKNGSPTSCNLLVIDSKAATVAATCLDYSGDGKLDSSSTYDVYLDSGLDGQAAKYRVENATVYVHYNPETLANNIAILQYNSEGSITWKNSYASVPNAKWDMVVYERNILTDMKTMRWAARKSYIYSPDDARSVCQRLSNMAVGLSGYVLSSDYSTGVASVDSSSCAVPYGVLYGVFKGSYYMLGMHSHTFIQGGADFCNYNVMCNYHMFASRYVTYVMNIIGRSFDIGADIFYTNNSNVPPEFNLEVPPPDKDRAILTGDLYKYNKANTEMSSASSSEANSGLDSVEGSSGGLSRKYKIIVSACVSVGGLLLISAAVLYVVKWRRRRRWHSQGTVNPIVAEQVEAMFVTESGYNVQVLRALSSDVAQLANTDDLPPLYEDPPANPPLQPRFSTQATDSKDEKGGSDAKA